MDWRWKMVRLLAGLAVVVYVSACGASYDSKRYVGMPSALPQNPSQPHGQPESGRPSTVEERTGAAGDELQSRKDKELVLLFAALLQMDKKPELALTGAQANVIMPIAKAGKEKGELAAGEEQKIVAPLTADQARFLTEFRDRAAAQRKKFRELKPEERAAMIEQFKQRRKQEDSGTRPDGDESDAIRDSAGSGLRSGAAGGKGGEHTIEQQLLEMLEARLSQTGKHGKR